MPLSFSYHHAPVAQLDRVPGYELGGREFESLRARQVYLSEIKQTETLAATVRERCH